MLISKKMLSNIEDLVERGYILKVKHPDFPLHIYSYTKKCQRNWLWTPETILCRGLILHNDVIISRPFIKFFSYEQYRELGNKIKQLYNVEPHFIFYESPRLVTEKIDGSLGIMYTWEGRHYIATRGSFESQQAIHATRILQEKYRDFNFIGGYTYLFEIVYPANKIIVDYGDLDDIILLAVISNETGKDDFKLFNKWKQAGNLSANVIKCYSIEHAQSTVQQFDNKEGVVLLFRNGIRLKVKNDRYCRIHRLMSNLSSIMVWECLRNNRLLDEVLDGLPQEYKHKVIELADFLVRQYHIIEKDAHDLLDNLRGLSRKEIADKLKNNNYRHIIFAMLDGKAYSGMIWKMLRPHYFNVIDVADENL